MAGALEEGFDFFESDALLLPSSGRFVDDAIIAERRRED
jgi:hypothetical protein